MRKERLSLFKYNNVQLFLTPDSISKTLQYSSLVNNSIGTF